jgi:uncharacterized membrane protein
VFVGFVLFCEKLLNIFVKNFMENLQQPAIIASTLVAGLVAGLFYTWSCGIVQGLGKLPDMQYLNAMQSINREIQQPLFFSSFMGALILLPFSAWFSYRGHHQEAYPWLLAASLLYIAGVFGVTVAGNVPLNNMLDKMPLHDYDTSLLARQRQTFEPKWNRLNLIRTVCAIAAFICAIIACVRFKA